MNEAVWMGSHADLGCSRPIRSKTSLRRHPLITNTPTLTSMLPTAHFCSSFTKGKMVSNQSYAASSSLFPMFLAWQHLIMNALQPGMDMGCSAHAIEQPCSAQILISALIWSRTGDIHCLGMATDPLCDRLHSQISSEGPGALQGQTL